MDFFARINNKEIGVYHYELNNEKLYHYKKEKIDQSNVLATDMKTKYQLGNHCFKLTENSINLSALDFHQHKFFYGKPTNKSKEEQTKLLEQYCMGELDCYLFDDGHHRVLFPEQIEVTEVYYKPADYKEQDIFVSLDGVLSLTKELYLLERIVRGNVYFQEEELSLLESQLQCFNFSNAPVDKVSLKTLDILCKDKESYNYPSGATFVPFPNIENNIIETAEKGAKVLEKIRQSK